MLPLDLFGIIGVMFQEKKSVNQLFPVDRLYKANQLVPDDGLVTVDQLAIISRMAGIS